MAKINGTKSSPAKKATRKGSRAAAALIAERKATIKAVEAPKRAQLYFVTMLNKVILHVNPLKNQ